MITRRNGNGATVTSDRRPFARRGWSLIALCLLAWTFACHGHSLDRDNAVCVSVEKPTDKRGARCNIYLGKENSDIAQAHAVRAGDRLEFDLLLSPNIPSVAGGLDLQFFGASGLFGLLTEQSPEVLREYFGRWKDAIGQWQRMQLPLDAAIGRKIERLLLRVEGDKPGLYQIVLDNIRITNAGKTQFPFYGNEPAFNITVLEANEFRSPTLVIFDRDKTATAAELPALMQALQKESHASRRMQAVARGLSMLLDEYLRLGKPEKLAQIEETRKAYEALAAAKEAGRIEGLDAELDKFLARAEWLRPFAKQFTVHAVSYAHLDFIWLWSWGETLQVATNDFCQMAKFMDEFPQFTFTYTSPALFEAVEMENPAVVKEVVKRVKAGQWEMIGSRWCEADYNLISEESHARHFLYGHRWTKQKFGTETTVCFEPDIFGHLWTTPQMLVKSGLQYYIGGRTERSPPVFWWEGPDGSRVLCLGPRHYSEILNENILDFTLTRPQRSLGYTDGLVIYGVGNHGGGPSHDQISAGISMDKLPVFPTVKFGTLQGYMDTIAAQPFVSNAPLIQTEIRQAWRGTYTTQAETKRLNRACENALTMAETWAAIAQSLGIGPPANRFDVAWRSLLWAHHHDTISGTTIKASAQFAQHVLGSIHKDIAADLQTTLTRFAALTKTKGATEHARVAFNNVAWPVTAPLRVELPDAKTDWEWVDARGSTAPICREREPKPATGTVVLNSLPALGYRLGWLRPARQSERSGQSWEAQNETLKLEVSPTSGNIVSLLHIPSRRSWIPQGAAGARFRIDHESPHDMSAWELGPVEKTEWLDKAESVERIEHNAVRTVFRARYRFGKSAIEKDIILYRGLSRVDFELRVDWQEKGTADTPAPLLRIEFPVMLANAKPVWLIPFGEIERPQSGEDFAASYGMGFTGDQGSVCLLNNSKNGYNATNDTIALTLIRSPYYPDPIPDVGRHRIQLALEISDRSWTEAAMSRRGLEFNRAPMVVATTPHDGQLPAEMSFLSVEPASVVLTALKASYDSPTRLVARFYQAANAPAKAKVSTALPLRSWVESDLIERPLSNSRPVSADALPLGRWEIKSYLTDK